MWRWLYHTSPPEAEEGPVNPASIVTDMPITSSPGGGIEDIVQAPYGHLAIGSRSAAHLVRSTILSSGPGTYSIGPWGMRFSTCR